VGWVALNLFRAGGESEAVSLVAGFFKVPVRQPPMPDPSKVSLSPTSQSADTGAMFLYLRVVHGKSAQQADQLVIDSDTHTGILSVLLCGVLAIINLWHFLRAAVPVSQVYTVWSHLQMSTPSLNRKSLLHPNYLRIP
jgi:hypothetical protein